MLESLSNGADRNAQQRPFLGLEERDAINRGRWFAALTPSLRHDILRLGRVTRYAHGKMIVEQGKLAQDWFTCASGAIRFRRTTPSGKQVTLAYVEPGIWVGEAEVLHQGANTYDAHAHGPTTVLSVAEAVFRQLLREHPSFGEALLTLPARPTAFAVRTKPWTRWPGTFPAPATGCSRTTWILKGASRPRPCCARNSTPSPVPARPHS